MIAVVADLKRDIARFLKMGRFSELDREGDLRFYSSSSIPHVVAATGGFSREEVERSVGDLAGRFNPDVIVSAGFASSANPDLATGEIVVCDRMMGVDGPAYSWRTSDAPEIETDPSIVESVVNQLATAGVEVEVGACVTLPQPVVNSPMKEWIGRTFDAAAADLEGYWTASAAQEFRIRFVPVRAIVDTMEQDVSLRAMEALRQSPARRALHSLGYVAGNPVRMAEVAKLSSQAGKARRSLAQFLYRLTRTRVGM